ncbi:hypothetical protein BT63DRAFT_414656 [Microthyrium microscopicum]|uniref:Uncharacterized protein n=1 Tax=Microthyrium microscopicum TaxID=703497 RepID=A0A6A6UBI1_9PEZI|nr:hypothetical protein BT63DRAFT_414656 [Microthyrium microscopicum]
MKFFYPILTLLALAAAEDLAKKPVSGPGSPPSIKPTKITGDKSKIIDGVPMHQSIDVKARNRHPEYLPQPEDMRKKVAQNVHDGHVKTQAITTCDCAPAICPQVRLTSAAVSDCKAAHAYACWRKNAACAKPVSLVHLETKNWMLTGVEQ